MNILFLNGSPRKNGYTFQLMKCIEQGIGSEHKIHWLHTNDLHMVPCQGCCKCRPSGECIHPEDDGHRAARLIRSADALVIGSPTYFGNITGPLKTLIDRSLTAFEDIAASGLEIPIPRHKGKNAAMVTACNTSDPISKLPSQSAGTLLAMETILNAGGYNIIGSIVLDGAAARTDIPSSVQEDAKRIGMMLLNE
jgi:multimeric flavodoxin WrbA